jgi:hypothetical protein
MFPRPGTPTRPRADVPGLLERKSHHDPFRSAVRLARLQRPELQVPEWQAWPLTGPSSVTQARGCSLTSPDLRSTAPVCRVQTRFIVCARCSGVVAPAAGEVREPTRHHQPACTLASCPLPHRACPSGEDMVLHPSRSVGLLHARKEVVLDARDRDRAYRPGRHGRRRDDRLVPVALPDAPGPLGAPEDGRTVTIPARLRQVRGVTRNDPYTAVRAPYGRQPGALNRTTSKVRSV